MTTSSRIEVALAVLDDLRSRCAIQVDKYNDYNEWLHHFACDSLQSEVHISFKKILATGHIFASSRFLCQAPGGCVVGTAVGTACLHCSHRVLEEELMCGTPSGCIHT